MSDYERGYSDGFMAGVNAILEGDTKRAAGTIGQTVARRTSKTVKKRQRSPKQRLLDTMSDKKWKQYKRTTKNGKKTYIDIRSEVSRSRDYKNKCKRM